MSILHSGDGHYHLGGGYDHHEHEDEHPSQEGSQEHKHEKKHKHKHVIGGEDL